jgi:Asp-tRNA(Asn)/Glu-tRNA(Gln) amidotransferase C subunit
MAVVPLSYPLINGYRYSWASVAAILGAGSFTQELSGLKSINYATEVSRGEARGAGRQRLGWTAGNVAHTASLEMLKEEYMNLVEQLSAIGPFLDQVFDIPVSYTENGVTKTDKVVGCRIKKDAHDHAQGTDALVVKIDLDIMYVLPNGVTTPFAGFHT